MVETFIIHEHKHIIQNKNKFVLKSADFSMGGGGGTVYTCSKFLYTHLLWFDFLIAAVWFAFCQSLL